jgi:hypothetical protein
MKTSPISEEFPLMYAPATLRYPCCDTTLSDGSSRCSFCGEWLKAQPNAFLNALNWVVKAYRGWSLGVFGFAVLHLLAMDHIKSIVFLFYLILPFGGALAISYRQGAETSRWIVIFLILVDLGVIIAPDHWILPALNMFPDLPRTQNRILTWYFLVYVSLQFVVAPPVFFFQSLRIAWSGVRPPLASWICLFGLAVWGLIVAIIVMLATQI